MRKIFRDKNLQAIFEQQGFVIIKNLFSIDQLEKITTYCRDLHPAIQESFFTSTYSNDKIYRKKADRLIQSVMADSLKNMLADYKPVYGNFMIKNSAAQGESELHQDWTFVDETLCTAVNAWSPLTDYKPNSGFIRVVKASDRFDIPYRGRNINSPLGNIRELIKSDYTTEIKINRGDTVIFNTRTFHCSADNTSGKTRAAVSLVMIPEEAEAVHYMMSPVNQGKIDMLKVDTDFFTDFGVWENPEGFVPAKSQAYECQKISDVEFIEKFRLFNQSSSSNKFIPNHFD